MKKVRLISMFIISLGAAGAAMGESSLDRLWKTLNENKDDVISATEAIHSIKVQEQWNLLDINQDGVLSYKEFALIDLTK